MNISSINRSSLIKNIVVILCFLCSFYTKATGCYSSIVSINDSVSIDTLKYVKIVDTDSLGAIFGDNVSDKKLFHNGILGEYIFYEIVYDTCLFKVDTIEHHITTIPTPEHFCTLHELDLNTFLANSLCENSPRVELIADTSFSFVQISGSGIIQEGESIYFEPSLVNDTITLLEKKNVLACSYYNLEQESIPHEVHLTSCTDSLPPIDTCYSLSSFNKKFNDPYCSTHEEVLIIDLSINDSLIALGLGVEKRNQTYVFNPQITEEGSFEIEIVNDYKCANQENTFLTIEVIDCSNKPKLTEEIFTPNQTPYEIPSEEDGIFSVYNYDGTLIKKISIQKDTPVFWDGTDQNGRPVPLGAYILHIKADNLSLIHI